MARPAADIEHALGLARAVLDREDLSAYHGWIKYLAFRAEHPNANLEGTARLSSWSTRILENSNTLSELRGVQEWAYESRADGSGQPFRISIPTRYDPARPMPLSLYLHGTGANHMEFPQVLEQLTGWTSESDFIEVAVLGRGRGVGYFGLGGADVLDVLDYVTQTFHIDAERVHLVGPSMGGNGVMWLAARNVDRFASAWTVCGSALDIPVANLVNLPVYATHGDADWAQPELMVRGALERLARLGGTVAWDLANGFGHAVWKYHSGNERARKWTFFRRRPRSSEVRHIDFTALDADSARAYWVAVEEWGPAPRPARFQVRVAQNGIEARLQNVTRLRLHLEQSPLDRTRSIPIHLRFDGKHARLQLSPVDAKDSVVIEVDPGSGQARLEGSRPRLPFRLHTPGGPSLLYNGEPVLIVYGTRGGARSQALRAAAERASRSGNANWDTESPSRTADAVPLRQNLYGTLRVKADVEVTQSDIMQKHLVLLGTAEQNEVVARIATRLPVTLSADSIDFNDGLSVSSRDRTMRMVHYNPEAPERLIYWLAANDIDAYAESSEVAEGLLHGSSAPDVLVTGGADAALVLSRSFDSRWRWNERERSPLLRPSKDTWMAVEELLAERLRQASHSDFVLTSALNTPEGTRAFAPGLTRISDVTPYYFPLSTMTLTGRQLLAADRTLSQPGGGDSEYLVGFLPRPSQDQIDPDRIYSVALTPDGVYLFPHRTQIAPAKIQLTELTVADVLDAVGAAEL